MKRPTGRAPPRLRTPPPHVFVPDGSRTGKSLKIQTAGGNGTGAVSSEEPCSEAKSLFDGVEVVSGPALFGALLLAVGHASTLHLQLRLIASVQEDHGDGGVMFWRTKEHNVTQTLEHVQQNHKRQRRERPRTTGPVVVPPLHHNLLIWDLVEKSSPTLHFPQCLTNCICILMSLHYP